MITEEKHGLWTSDMAQPTTTFAVTEQEVYGEVYGNLIG